MDQLKKAMRAKWVKWTLFVILLLLPFGLTVIYRAMTALPETVTLATGPEGGRYREFSLQLAKAIEEKFGVNVELVHTQGSLENIKLLEDGKVDFALYQPGTRDKLLPEDTKATRTVVFVANMYSEVAHFIVHQNSGIKQSQDLLEKSAEGRKKRVAVGQKNSGDYAMSLTLLKHFGVDAKLRSRPKI